jgi:hypothetical protein
VASNKLFDAHEKNVIDPKFLRQQLIHWVLDNEKRVIPVVVTILLQGKLKMTPIIGFERKVRSKGHQMYRSPGMMLAMMLAVAFIGVASPFAMGTADAAAGSNQRTLPPKSPLFQRPRSLAQKMSSTVASSEKTKSSPIRQFFHNLNPAGGKKDGRWKGGEVTATYPARLIFSYVAPLLDLASERRLDVEDAFQVAEHLKMNQTVTSLATAYDNARTKSQKRIEEQKARGEQDVKKSQSLVLLKALLGNQKGSIISTGILRLFNTAVQAFPSILVARLLRCVEAGDALPASTPILAAISLVAVLTLKMILENQFFHKVVTMSTQTRGALEGLIFDKSLRLPGGGSSMLSKFGNDKKKKALGSGGVLNLMQSDASIIESAAMQIHTIWDAPLQVSSCFDRLEYLAVSHTDTIFRRCRFLFTRHCCIDTWVRVCFGGLVSCYRWFRLIVLLFGSWIAWRVPRTNQRILERSGQPNPLRI